jgi:hypothetical protein
MAHTKQEAQARAALLAVELMRRGLPDAEGHLDAVIGEGFTAHYEAWRKERSNGKAAHKRK